MKQLGKDFPPALIKFFSDTSQAGKSALKEAREYKRHHRGSEEKNRSFAWILSNSGLPWLKLDLKIPYKEMLAEAKKLRDRFVEHRSDPTGMGYAAKGWKALCLHALSPTKSLSFNVYGYETEDETPYRWTQLADLCPRTKAFFQNRYPCDTYYRVRVMVVEPGGYILPHTDRKESMLWEVNFALNNPEGCFFKMKGHGYVPYKPRSAYVLDVSNQHAVVNLSKEDRYHLIVHGKPLLNADFQKMIRRSYSKFLASKLD